jgi:hypothetical protein
LTLSGVRIESPAVIRAFDLPAFEAPAGKRHAAMGARVAQGKSLALRVATDDQRLFEQHGLRELAAMDPIRWQGAVPESEEHERVGRLGLEWNFVGH